MTDQIAPTQATPAMINRGVEFAINAKISGEYPWPTYIAELYAVMAAAAERTVSAESSAVYSALDRELERQEALVKVYRRAQLTAEEKLCRETANARGWKARAEYLETKLTAAPPSADVGELVGRKYRMGDRVTKTKGSSWTGLVVGFYSTSLTPIGYAVESENEPGSVQIYPESALAKHGGAA